MRGNSHFILLGIFLAFTFVQLVSSKPDFFESSQEEASDEDDHEDHAEHHQHHQFVPSPFNHDDHNQGKSVAGADTVKATATASASASATATGTNSNNQNAPQKAAPLSFGTNVSGFNEPCNNTRICNTDKSLECLSSNSTCQCTKNFVYVAQREGCLVIAGMQDTRSGIMSVNCEFDVQCRYGRWGTDSRCEPATKVCQCTEAAIYLDNTCLLKRTIGATCVTDKQCNLTMAGEAVCKLPPNASGTTRFCECADGYIWDNHHLECLKIALNKPYNSTCKSDRQCQASSLGNFSRCDHEALQCRCHDPVKPGEENAIVYKDTCYPRKYINDTCTAHIECEAGIENAVCEEHPAFMTEKVCKCPSGKKCELRKNSAMGIFGSEMSRFTLVCVAVVSVIIGRMSLGQTNVI